MVTKHLLNETLTKNMGRLSNRNALVVNTAPRTGRSTQERFVCADPRIENTIEWGKVNQKIELDFSNKFFNALKTSLSSGDRYSTKRFVGPYPIEIFSRSPWHIMFCKNMFREVAIQEHLKFNTKNIQIKVYHEPFLKPSDLGLNYNNYETLIILDPAEHRIGIIGTAYAGEIKKGAFSMCNYLLPDQGIFPMHASANCSIDGSNSSVLFGLSGTGKTTLSADPERFLIGDDEIIWTQSGISNLEGGCYAKLINLSHESEPEIYHAVNLEGSIMENVCFLNDSNEIDFNNNTITENTRGSYPLQNLKKVYDQGREAQAPKSIIFLTADAFGALPAVAKLNPWQAQFHFLNGYTARVAGTEMGVKEPQAVFSACFGAPFMPRSPMTYAGLLKNYIEKHNTEVWLVNTGWSKIMNGDLQRFPIHVSRQILKSIQNGTLKNQKFVKHSKFGFEVPTQCEGVDSKLLGIPDGQQVSTLVSKFLDNSKVYQNKIDARIFNEGAPLQ